jgi:hypothetical protein
MIRPAPGCASSASRFALSRPMLNSLSRAQNSVMTAIIYFSEMLVASLLAILLLAISHIRMSLDAVLFLGGVVGWTLAEYLVHRFVLHSWRLNQPRDGAVSCLLHQATGIRRHLAAAD